MKKIIFNLLFVILIKCYHGYAREMLLDGSNKNYMISSIIPSSDGNPLRYMIFNLFDNNLNTTVAVNSKYKPYKEDAFPYFRIVFKEPYKIDKIVIYNGYQKSDELYSKNSRAKDILITVLNHIEKEKNKKYSVSIETNFLLNDTKEPQVIDLPDVSGDYWIVNFKSTYPGSGSDDICISEIEFWYKGEKYEVKNLEEAKKEYLQARRRHELDGLQDTYHSLTRIGYELDYKDKIFSLWKKLGVDVDKLYLYYPPEVERVDLYIKFARESIFSFSGDITALKKDDKIIRNFKGKNKYWLFDDLYVKKSLMKIGEWKIDEYGRIWMKVGKGEWKWYRRRFPDTDFGEVRGANVMYDEDPFGIW